MSATRPLTAQAHDAALSSGIAVLVFIMSQSPACKSFRPSLDQVAAERASVPFYVVDAEQEPELAKLHHLQALPTCIFYRDGSPIRRTAGGMSAYELAAVLDEVLQADMLQEIHDLMLEMALTQEVLSPLLGAAAAQGRPSGRVGGAGEGLRAGSQAGKIGLAPRGSVQPLSPVMNARTSPARGKTGQAKAAGKSKHGNDTAELCRIDNSGTARRRRASCGQVITSPTRAGFCRPARS
jgi:thiol-disulfide isomerase/thioredoxin